MTIMTIRIPDDVKEALDKAFEGEDKDAIIAQFIRDGLAARAAEGHAYEGAGEHEQAAKRRREAVDAILALRKQPPYFSDADIKRAREEGRP
jgi:predicted transcriptional regulator